MTVFTHFVCNLPTSKICVKSDRYAGYNQYFWWIHKRLGKGVRKMIPSCTIWTIRNSFPSENQEYTPFIESI